MVINTHNEVRDRYVIQDTCMYMHGQDIPDSAPAGTVSEDIPINYFDYTLHSIKHAMRLHGGTRACNLIPVSTVYMSLALLVAYYIRTYVRSTN